MAIHVIDRERLKTMQERAVVIFDTAGFDATLRNLAGHLVPVIRHDGPAGVERFFRITTPGLERLALVAAAITRLDVDTGLGGVTVRVLDMDETPVLASTFHMADLDPRDRDRSPLWRNYPDRMAVISAKREAVNEVLAPALSYLRTFARGKGIDLK